MTTLNLTRAEMDALRSGMKHGQDCLPPNCRSALKANLVAVLGDLSLVLYKSLVAFEPSDGAERRLKADMRAVEGKVDTLLHNIQAGEPTIGPRYARSRWIEAAPQSVRRSPMGPIRLVLDSTGSPV